ncbi:hypothetical protein LUZ60_006146 [Juncus effusus]|nr:hypothetical protein LUZ60_006146 [Juncus effusus]
MESSGAGGGGGAGDAAASLSWHDFLERMRHPAAGDLVKSIKSFVVTFSNTDPDPDMDSRAMQEFFTNMENLFRVHPLFAGCSEEELDGVCEGLEKYLMNKLYNRTFATIPEDVRSDEILFEKMGLLQHFIRPENLDIKPQYHNESAWLLAQKELQKINMNKAPRDKLACIMNCCNVITNLLINASASNNDNPPGADEVLPVLIYVTIKANPPQLHSNLQYIQRFRRQSRLVGESAYYFTNVLSAESFVWNIDGNALSIDESEFQRKMDSARDFLLGNNIKNNDINDNVNINVNNLENEMSVGRESSSERVGMTEKDRVGTALELEKKGSREILKENNIIKYFDEYPYLYARAGDLTVSDVEELLGCYKRLVLQYVSLSKGIGGKVGIPENEIRENEIRENEIQENEIRENEILENEIRENEVLENEIRESIEESEMKSSENEKVREFDLTENVEKTEPVKELEPGKELVDEESFDEGKTEG